MVAIIVAATAAAVAVEAVELALAAVVRIIVDRESEAAVSRQYLDPIEPTFLRLLLMIPYNISPEKGRLFGLR